MSTIDSEEMTIISLKVFVVVCIGPEAMVVILHKAINRSSL